jgi:hypothetical protein
VPKGMLGKRQFVLGWCLLALVVADLAPGHVYLSLNGNSNSMQVTFTTSSYPTNPCLQYGTSTGAKSNYIMGQKNNILTFKNPNSNAVDYITSLTITGLSRDTYYSYSVYGECKDSGTSSGEFSFKTLPEDNGVFNIGFYGDLGSDGASLVQEGPGGLVSYSSNFDFIVHNGDMAYDLSSDNGTNGNVFLTRIQPISSQIPYLVTPGNHEFNSHSDPIYYNNWFWGQSSLGNQSGSVVPVMWYSFDPSPSIHIIAISTEVYCEDPGDLEIQWEWLVNDLEEVTSRKLRPWIIMFGHRQMYHGTKNDYHSRLMRYGVQCNDSSLANCDKLEPCKAGANCAYSLEKLLEEYSVDILLAGHKHTYSRMFPIAGNLTYETQDENLYLNPQFPVYIISGAAGKQPQNFTDSELEEEEEWLVSKKKKDTTPTAAGCSDFTFSHMQIFNLTHIYIEQIDSGNATVVDYVWIVKDSTHPPWSGVKEFELDTPKETECN